jgi:hypothetical protein
MIGYHNLGSVKYTGSHVVNGKQRSERGLFDMTKNEHVFVRTAHDEYPDDISNEATKNLRTELVPPGASPLGYVYEGDQAYWSDGSVIWENLHASPPLDDTPYTPFYGEKYLVLEEMFEGAVNLPAEAYKQLFECLMRVRYNGPSTKSFFDITRIMCGDYLQNIEITPSNHYYLVSYELNGDAVLSDRLIRFNAWKLLCRQKFKLFYIT